MRPFRVKEAERKYKRAHDAEVRAVDALDRGIGSAGCHFGSPKQSVSYRRALATAEKKRDAANVALRELEAARLADEAGPLSGAWRITDEETGEGVGTATNMVAAEEEAQRLANARGRAVLLWPRDMPHDRRVIPPTLEKPKPSQLQRAAERLNKKPRTKRAKASGLVAPGGAPVNLAELRYVIEDAQTKEGLGVASSYDRAAVLAQQLANDRGSHVKIWNKTSGALAGTIDPVRRAKARDKRGKAYREQNARAAAAPKPRADERQAELFKPAPTPVRKQLDLFVRQVAQLDFSTLLKGTQ